ncbi:hypothetical protein ACFQPF_01485 [Fictibacillus iocasae]|uniref:Uncharacterized protein n=1 Tax=Fictibacillus iocasae TaxID=2715437 RepID=A0ABW2NNV3_9BACL
MVSSWITPLALFLLNMGAAYLIMKPTLSWRTLLFYAGVLAVSILYPLALYDDHVNPVIGANIGLGLAFMFAAGCSITLIILALVLYLQRSKETSEE